MRGCLSLSQPGWPRKQSWNHWSELITRGHSCSWLRFIRRLGLPADPLGRQSLSLGRLDPPRVGAASPLEGSPSLGRLDPPQVGAASPGTATHGPALRGLRAPSAAFPGQSSFPGKPLPPAAPLLPQRQHRAHPVSRQFYGPICDVSSKSIYHTINTESIFITGGRQKGRCQQSSSQSCSDKWLYGSSPDKTLLVDDWKDQVTYLMLEKGHWSYYTEPILGQSAFSVVMAAVFTQGAMQLLTEPACFVTVLWYTYLFPVSAWAYHCSWLWPGNTQKGFRQGLTKYWKRIQLSL